MRDFRVPKERIAVTLLVADKVRQCVVFVSPVSTQHDGSEELSDLLCNDDPFLSIEERGSYVCLPKDVIAVAWVERPPPSLLGRQYLQATENRVLVKLVGGRQLRGVVRYQRHPDSSRLVDYLNAEPQFFTLHQKKLALINRRFVASVVFLPHAATPPQWRRKASERRRVRREAEQRARPRSMPAALAPLR